MTVFSEASPAAAAGPHAPQGVGARDACVRAFTSSSAARPPSAGAASIHTLAQDHWDLKCSMFASAELQHIVATRAPCRSARVDATPSAHVDAWQIREAPARAHGAKVLAGSHCVVNAELQSFRAARTRSRFVARWRATLPWRWPRAEAFPRRRRRSAARKHAVCLRRRTSGGACQSHNESQDCQRRSNAGRMRMQARAASGRAPARATGARLEGPGIAVVRCAPPCYGTGARAGWMPPGRR
jgi:hypothetical protein